MHRLGGVRVPRWDIVLGAGEKNPQVRTKPTMYKRMLRSALAASFVVAMGFGLAGGGDIAWSSEAASVPGDIAWSVEAAAVPGDIAWGMNGAALPGDIAWGIDSTAQSGDIAWSTPAGAGA